MSCGNSGPLSTCVQITSQLRNGDSLTVGLDGTAYMSPTYHKLTLIGDYFETGDDCLNLNIWTPDVHGLRLPVVVWIHGVAFRTGSNAVTTYNGSAFAPAS